MLSGLLMSTVISLKCGKPNRFEAFGCRSSQWSASLASRCGKLAHADAGGASVERCMMVAFPTAAVHDGCLLERCVCGL